MYLEDGLSAVVNGEGISFGINNNDMPDAFAAVKAGISYDVGCWARPHEGSTNPHTTVDKNLGKDTA